MSQSHGYNFCPNCGAVTKDGVCTSCGRKSKGAVFNKPSETVSDSDRTVFDYTKTDVTTSFAGSRGVLNGGTGKRKTGGVLVPAIVSFALILIFTGALYGYFRFRFASENASAKSTVSETTKTSVSVSETEKADTETEFEAESDVPVDVGPGYFKTMVLNKFSLAYLEDEEVEAEEDLYDYPDNTDYYVYDDFIRTDLDYKIINTAWEYNGFSARAYGRNAPEDVYIYCSYPQIKGAPEFEEIINNTILEKTMHICDMYEIDCEYLEEEEFYYGDEHVYITYMDGDVLSLMFYYDGYFATDSEEEPTLVSFTADAVNYDMKTGKEIEMPKIALSDDAFIEKFIEAVNEQNQSDILEDISKSDLLLDYKNGNFIWFYNPFGVEIGYCVPYNYGFYSCTMNPDEIFKK